MQTYRHWLPPGLGILSSFAHGIAALIPWKVDTIVEETGPPGSA